MFLKFFEGSVFRVASFGFMVSNVYFSSFDSRNENNLRKNTSAFPALCVSQISSCYKKKSPKSRAKRSYFKHLRTCTGTAEGL